MNGLFYLGFAAFYFGLPIQESCFFLILICATLAAVRGRVTFKAPPHSRWVLALLACMVISFLWFKMQIPEGRAKIHWTLVAFFLVGFFDLSKIQWENLHRALLWASLPGLIYSAYWLLRPAEIEWALKVGFASFPRASGLVSNPIIHAEGLMIAVGWSLARLQTQLSKRERRAILGHLFFALTIVLFSRVRSGIVAFAVLMVLTYLWDNRSKQLALVGGVFTVAVFMLTLMVFGFNSASILKRFELFRISWELWQSHPWLGIGPHAFRNFTDAGVHTHNTTLGMGTELGLLGFAVYIGLMAVLIAKLIRLWRRGSALPSESQWIVRALTLGFATYLAVGMFEFNFHLSGVLLFHALHWGVIAALPLAKPSLESET